MIMLPDHHIQRDIYDRLVHASQLRYSQLKPDNVEANSFMYHLKELIKIGLVEKTDSKQYRLSSDGQALASRFSVKEKRMRLMPTTISIIYLTAPDGQVLLYERMRQPFIGALEFPSGKIHHGQSLHEAANREMLEKTGYKDIDLDLRGSISITSGEEDGIASYSVIGFVWMGSVTEKLVHEDVGGRAYWADLSDQDFDEFIPGTRQVVEVCSLPGPFNLDLAL